MRHSIKHAFTMIEIMLALGVTAIGICSIMVLFPIGANANRDASVDTFSANAAEELLHLFKYEITENGQWDTYIGTSGSLLETTPAAVANLAFDPMEANPKSAWATIPLGTSPNVIPSTAYPGAFLIISTTNGTSTPWSTLDPQDVDLAAIMVITKKKLNLNGNDIDYKYAVTLEAEVSWPAALPKNRRQTATYSLDVFKN